MLLQSTRNAVAESAAPPGLSTAGDYVILLHGLRRGAISMKRVEWSLRREGYRVINVSYPSTRQNIETSAAVSLAAVLKTQILDPNARVHFVTHSLGGIVLREYLANHHLANLGRAVMLGPPNQGSELAQLLKRNRLFRFCTGPAGQQLGTDATSRPRQLGPARFELGIIAGSRSLNPLLSAAIPGPDDGKVAVARTRLEGANDFLVVPYSHTWLAWRGVVLTAVERYLRTGAFRPAAAST